MKVSTKKNDGVSPVIGTILLVAITVALVAIISAVVMGMTGGVGTTHTVGIQMANGAGAGNVSITFLSGSTAGLTNLTVFNGTETTYDVPGTFTIGQSYNATVGAGDKSIIVVGVFSDGNQTLLNQQITVT